MLKVSPHPDYPPDKIPPEIERLVRAGDEKEREALEKKWSC